MSDFEYIPEGKDYVNANGWPATVYFLLSTEDVATLGATPTLAGGVGEITGTGYTRKSQARPTSSGGKLQFAQMSWATGSATDWQSAKSCIAVTSADNTGKALAAWNLQAGGAARVLGAANTTENFTPDFTA